MISLKNKLIKLPVWSHYVNTENYVYINPKLIVAVKENRATKNVAGSSTKQTEVYCVIDTSTSELDIEADETPYIVMNSVSYNIALSFEELSNVIEQWYVNKTATKYIEGVVNEKQ